MKDKNGRIVRFRGEHGFLSNFFETPVTVFGRTYRNAEAAYQSARVPPERVEEFTKLNAKDANRLGRKLSQPGWEDRRVEVMREVLRAKFADSTLRQMLLSTGDAAIIEGAPWMARSKAGSDLFWCMWPVSGPNARGENTMGKLLMELRAELGRRPRRASSSNRG
jgi:ribA/ribD-fused uncharacterized protein